MITAKVNGRTLAVWFNYSNTYSVDVFREDWHDLLKARLASVPKDTRAAVKAQFKRSEPRYTRVQRPLTQCYLGEGVGKDACIIAKFEVKLHVNDRAFPRKSEKMEQLRHFMLTMVLKQAGATISKTERRALWTSFLTRHTVKPNVAIKPAGGEPPPAATAAVARPIPQVVDAVAPPADTVPEGNRVVIARRTQVGAEEVARAGTHAVTNKVVSIGRRWNYRALPATPDLLDDLARMPVYHNEQVH